MLSHYNEMKAPVSWCVKIIVLQFVCNQLINILSWPSHAAVERKHSSSELFADHSKAVLFCGSFLLFMLHVCLYYAFLSVPCSLVITGGGGDSDIFIYT